MAVPGGILSRIGALLIVLGAAAWIVWALDWLPEAKDVAAPLFIGGIVLIVIDVILGVLRR